jgi:uncharacterized protein (TIGR00251 family)
MTFFQETSEGIVLNIRVQPRSSRNQMSGLHGDALTLKLTSPPVEGAANKQCISFLAKCLGISRSSVEIIAGQKSRSKKFKLHLSEKNQRKELINKLHQLSS